MNPKEKEKAKELFEKMYQYQWRKDTIEFKNAKQCALIAVSEIIQEYQSMSDSESVLVINNEVTSVVKMLVYWLEVKQEIEKL